MADNYLEKKMEEHRRGGAPSYRPRLTPRGTRPGEWLVKFTPCDVFVDEASPALMQEIVAELAGIGFKVSFSMPDSRAGAILAQKSGARFLPRGSATLQATQQEECLKITSDNGAILISSSSRQSRISFPSESEEGVKTVVWEAVMLANFNRFSEKMLRNIKIERVSL